MDADRLYLETTDVDFARWLVDRCQAVSEASWPSGAGRIIALQAHQRPVLGQYLGIDIGGVYSEGGMLAGRPSGLLHFTVLPIGRGNYIEVHATCAEPALRPYLDRLIVEMAQLWVRDRDDLDPDKRHLLRQMHLSADLAGFAAGLREWTAAYRDDEVQAASFFIAGRRTAAQEGIAPQAGPARQSWIITLRLRSWNRPWAGIHELKLELEAAEQQGRQSLAVVVAQPGFRYREAQPFVEALTAYCRRAWRAIPMTHGVFADRPPSSQTDARPGSPDLFGRLPWELVPDHLWDRKALQLWWQGRSCPEIGRDVHQSAKTILNRLCTLRKSYGTAIVPTDQQRLEKGIRVRAAG